LKYYKCIFPFKFKFSISYIIVFHWINIINFGGTYIGYFLVAFINILIIS